MKAGLPLIKNVLIPFATSILTSLGLSVGMSAADAAIKKKKSWMRNYSIIIFQMNKWKA